MNNPILEQMFKHNIKTVGINNAIRQMLEKGVVHNLNLGDDMMQVAMILQIIGNDTSSNILDILRTPALKDNNIKNIHRNYMTMLMGSASVCQIAEVENFASDAADVLIKICKDANIAPNDRIQIDSIINTVRIINFMAIQSKSTVFDMYVKLFDNIVEQIRCQSGLQTNVFPGNFGMGSRLVFTTHTIDYAKNLQQITDNIGKVYTIDVASSGSIYGSATEGDPTDAIAKLTRRVIDLDFDHEDYEMENMVIPVTITDKPGVAEGMNMIMATGLCNYSSNIDKIQIPDGVMLVYLEDLLKIMGK
jgi:predicted amino acid-binding ACT domain protein